MSSEIHSTAIVSPSAKIGSGVSIGAYSIVGENVTIGANTTVGPHVVIEGHTTIGEKCRIFQFASIGAEPQDLKFSGEASTLVIGNRNIIRECVTLQPGTKGGRMTTTIGDGNLFMAYSHVGHDCEVGSDNIFANQAALSGHVFVGNRSVIGGLSAIHQFARVGDCSFTAAGAMVEKDIPPYCYAHGDRARLRGINAIGLKRAGFNEKEVVSIKKAYRHLFGSLGKLEDKIETLDGETKSTPAVEALVSFIKESERGICPTAKSISSS